MPELLDIEQFCELNLNKIHRLNLALSILPLWFRPYSGMSRSFSLGYKNTVGAEEHQIIEFYNDMNRKLDLETLISEFIENGYI